MKNYILNKETRRIELIFLKEEYKNLNEKSKKKLKSAFLFSGKSKAWVSRSTNNHYRAIVVANELGFLGEEKKGQRLSFEEELLNKQKRAEEKKERYLSHSKNAEERAKEMQKEFNKNRGDIAFLTQPIIRGHKGSETFGRKRENIMNRYRKGFEEYRKSDCFIEKAELMQNVIDGKKFQDRVYLSNRIKKCNKNIKLYEKNIIWCEENNKPENIEKWVEKVTYEIDKLAYMENCLDEIGGLKYNESNLIIGYEIKIRGHWEKILKLNKRTVESQPIEEHLKSCYGKRDYSEIQETRIPKDFKVMEKIKNPFKTGNIFTVPSIGGNRIIKAYQAIKTTEKTVTIKQINLDENKKPVKDSFKIGIKESRRTVKKSKFDGKLYISDGDYVLYKYND